MHVSIHADPDRSIVVESIDPSNSERVTLREPSGSTTTLFLHSRDALRMIAAALPLAPDCSLYLGNARIEDQDRILRWIAGDNEQSADPTLHPRKSTAQAEQRVTGAAQTCAGCGSVWHGRTLFYPPKEHEAGRVVSCGDCGYDQQKHAPVIWRDGAAAE
jgi:hypothetical protein